MRKQFDIKKHKDTTTCSQSTLWTVREGEVKVFVLFSIATSVEI